VAKKIDCPSLIVKRPFMHIRVPCAAVVVGVFLGAGWRAMAAPAQPSHLSHPSEERRLVVVEAPGNVLTKAARERLHAAIADVAIRNGLAAVSSKTLPEQLLTCALPGCLPPIAAASGAIFVLRLDAKFAKESFKLVVELWNSDDGKLLGTDRRDCPICDEQDLWGSAALLTQGLLERVLREPVKSAPAFEASGEQAVTPAAPTSIPEVHAAPSGPLGKYLGLGLSVAGLATAALGVYYLAIDGNSAGNQSDRVRDTGKYGLPMTIAGGVALVSGLGLLTWHFWPGRTEVSLGPSGLQLAGRF